VLQYELRHQEHVDCGGSYNKLFSDPSFDPANVSNETAYSIMFGPDVCAYDGKVHFIFRSRNFRTKKIEEHHLKERPRPKDDRLTHLYTLVVRADNSVEILIDNETVCTANLLDDFEPGLTTPRLIPDPTDVKPDDWVEQETIEDPDATKPDDWDEAAPPMIPDPARLEPPPGWLPDEPLTVPDPDERKPEDWDEDTLGPWEAQTKVPNPRCKEAPGCGKYEVPQIPNPAYKGPWWRPRIPNPAYKGPWKQKMIPNPKYVPLPGPPSFGVIVGAGFEDWMVSSNVGFANVYIGTDEAALRKWNEAHFIPKWLAQAAENKRTQDDAGKSEDL
jgi:calnexin